MNECRRPQLFIGRAQRAVGGLLRSAATRRLGAGWLYAAALATGFTGLAACGSQPTGVEVIDGDTSAADSGTDTGGDAAPPELDVEPSIDTDPTDSPDGDDARDIDSADSDSADSDSADSDPADTPSEDGDAAPCETVDPCGACADGTFVPLGAPDTPCGPCAASHLVCRDGLTVCDMSGCACDGSASCSDGEACTAGVCAPEGWTYVPPGEYTKGCTEAFECQQIEIEFYPPRRMLISRGLLVRTTEETEESWQQMMGERTVHTDAAPGLPAVLFTFDEVATYLNLRSLESGLQPCYVLIDNETNYLDEWPMQQACDGWRLPTEAEWGYFTRAGTDTRTWVGNSRVTDYLDLSRDPLIDRIAYYMAHIAPLVDDPNYGTCGPNVGDNTGAIDDILANEPACRPVPGGQLEANPWGLHDVIGNVLELVWDREGANREYTGLLDPIRPSTLQVGLRWPSVWGDTRTRHGFGGFYGDNAYAMQYLAFYQYRDDRPHLQVGFRAVRSLPGVRLGRTVEPR